MTEPFAIDPAAVYDNGTLRMRLGLTDAQIAKARREGRLRFARQGRRVFYLGRWLLDWLHAEAEVSTPRRDLSPMLGGKGAALAG
jgi:hypothetical protein